MTLNHIHLSFIAVLSLAFAACGSSSVRETASLTPEFILPFDSDTEVICTKASGVGSHSYANALFALDLATEYHSKPAIVRAAADGIAFPFGREDGSLCPEEKGTPRKTEPSTCGMSWGNRIKIVHNNKGLFSFYVHLDSLLVKSGQILKAGDPIGMMGSTGMAGHRHLHWSVQQIPAGNENKASSFDWTGNSIPLKFYAQVEGQKQLVDASKLYCPHARVGEVKNQPRFRGVEK